MELGLRLVERNVPRWRIRFERASLFLLFSLEQSEDQNVTTAINVAREIPTGKRLDRKKYSAFFTARSALSPSSVVNSTILSRP